MSSYTRILVKVSGERVAGESHDRVLDMPSLQEIANELKDLHNQGVQVAVVIGGGNMIRGKEVAALGIEAAQGHQMGMLATVINALALQSVLESKGVHSRVMSAIEIDRVAEPYIRRRAMRHMEKGRIVIFAAGTGNPFFTTDTAGALRAIEIGAQVYIKATKVDGIYDSDPVKNPAAKHLPKLSYKDVLVDDLKVMDGAAVALCRENQLPLMVCKVGDVAEALQGKAKFTLVQ
ncbi:MAG: UMP kinase [Alphaproteobacteria bacterium]|nr:UMP kinase [Alphaproteobacteria bacterium]